jgi:hypothetical protein
MALAIDREEDFVEMPCVAGSGTSAPELGGRRLAELAAPFGDGFVGRDHPTGQQQLFDIAVAETEAEVQTDTVGNNFRRETMAFVGISCRWCAHVATMPHWPRARQLGRLS